MIRIIFSKDSYEPGEEVNAEIFVSLSKPTKCRGLYGIVEGIERKHVVTKRHLEHYDFERMKEMGVTPSTNVQVTHREEHNKIFHKEFNISGEKEYEKETFNVKFFLPRDAAPTSHDFGHDNRINIWRLKIRLDIPLALDENAEGEIFVEGLGENI